MSRRAPPIDTDPLSNSAANRPETRTAKTSPSAKHHPPKHTLIGTFRTVCQLVAAFDGQSLLPVLAGTGQLPADRPLFFRRRMANNMKDEFFIRQSAVRQGDMKYIRSSRLSG